MINKRCIRKTMMIEKKKKKKTISLITVLVRFLILLIGFTMHKTSCLSMHWMHCGILTPIRNTGRLV